MPGPLAKGVIIVASVLVAASIAAYENPQVREWVNHSSQKVALAFRSLGDDLHGRQRRQSREDSSMHEDADEQAEERRRQARQEIMEKGRALQERRKRSRPSADSSRAPSFDSMVDEEGRLRAQEKPSTIPAASSSAIDHGNDGGLRSRHENPQMHESVDAPILLRQLDSNDRPTPAVAAIEPWESQYEREMRNAWNIDLPARSLDPARSHASESLIDFTPTTEDFPDPDYSVPSLPESQRPLHRDEYFSAAASQTSHSLAPGQPQSGSGPQPEPLTPLDPMPLSPEGAPVTAPSSQASLAGSIAHVGHSEADMTDDDFSDLGDGIRTPASAWTEVGSSVSGDDGDF